MGNKNKIIRDRNTRNQEVNIIHGCSITSQSSVNGCRQSDRLFCERQDDVLGSKFKKQSQLLLGITVFQSAEDFVVRDDAEVDLTMLVQICLKPRNNSWIASEKHGKNIRINGQQGLYSTERFKFNSS